MTAHTRIDAPQVNAWNAARRFARLPSGEVAYFEKGTGRAALFLHGFPLNSLQWWVVTDALAQDRRCIAPDLLGLGHTRPRGGVTFGEQAEMTRELLDQLGLDSADIVANDSGTGVAQLFAARYPDRVRSLLLTNGDVEPDSPPPPMAPVIALAKAGQLADQVFGPSLADPDAMRSAQGIGGLTFTDPDNLTDAAIVAFLAPLLATDERRRLANAYAAAMDPNPLVGLEPRLRQLRAPCRIVWGTGDGLFAVEDAAYLDRTLARSIGVRQVVGAKVFWPLEFPEIVVEECRALWRVT